MLNDDLIQALRQALAAAPDSLPLRRHLAELLLAAGQYAEAAAEYRRALDAAPQDGSIKLSLAEAYRRQGKPEVSAVILEEVLRSTPAGTELYEQARLAHQNLASGMPQDPAPTPPPPPEEAEPPRVPLPSLEATPPPATEIERPGLAFKDVGGMEALKDEIRVKIIYPLTNPEFYRAYGKPIGGGILMYGPPGCGKTLLARATAGEVQARFLAVGIHDVLDMYVGQSEHNLHEIFELARANTPCVLFFDEVDALGASRADLRHSAGRQTINQFLAEMDGTSGSNEGVLVLAATNAPWHLDPALRRPGRFDRVIFVPPPDLAARAAILRLLLAGKPCEKVDFERLARETEGFSGADLRGVVDVAVEQSLREALQKKALVPLSMRALQAATKQAHPATREWFSTARNYALYANQSGLYDEILDFLQIKDKPGLLSRRP